MKRNNKIGNSKNFNPFIISGYEGPEYFCDREKESQKIISALLNGRNITLISPRRMGKTGLIHHIFYEIKKQNKNTQCFYLDIFATQNLYEFINLFGKTIIGKLDSVSENVMKNITSILKSFRPNFSINPNTGEVSVSLNIQKEDSEIGLKEIFDYLKDYNNLCYIAIDEFQQITEYPEKGVEALLRSYIQFLPNVKFIFAGSKKHIMDSIFFDINRPFYQSTQKIGLKEIAQEKYRTFAVEHFLADKQLLPANVFDYIYKKTFGHTWYIQLLLNQLYSLKLKEISIDYVNEIIYDVLEEENSTFKTYCEIISKGQLNLLRAIANEKKISEPTESKFMLKYSLTAPSSVKTALKSLIEKNLIIKDDNNYYYVYDKFFSFWLEQST
ncbi:MAG: ATP-binding protein [Bacteroidales bacterium]|jgi:DNA-binding MarR family transcriptional regulator|nr:ATP-binding protein [Bacteroidales bacterium]